MYKIPVRSFALGILFSASLIGAVYFFADKNNEDTLEEAKENVKNAGFIILTEEEYYELISEITENSISKKISPNNEAEPGGDKKNEYP